MKKIETLPEIVIRRATAFDDEWIETLGAIAFGPGRFSRSAFRLREGVRPDPELCFVATSGNQLVGSIRLTRILISKKRALVLGPLMISPTHRSLGIGRELMNRSLLEAKAKGYNFVVLVGDYAYYRSFGFERIEPGKITFPGPADPARILGCELAKDAANEYSGETKRDFAMSV